ncbi:hypothetical protein ACPOL_0586 [Acidisarcina polymorpha]|uniref:DUF418 domain-containing protein n=1 Tax=Acidisarcina polymorpha TaxID=2211140 RepID=A0A2Z5FSZ8_9BACT|nr:DUF418 domain-containing protein [Acidisarcina polymorpha]AXC09959.1 hypothetical protein ACPOL_0586 [Acidisarcina polymorpha]
MAHVRNHETDVQEPPYEKWSSRSQHWRGLSAETAEKLGGSADTPVQRGERLQTVDVLRGFALLGILLLNIQDFAGYETITGFPPDLVRPGLSGWQAFIDWGIVTFNWLFVQSKMRGLFAMLFGAGAVLLTERIEMRGGRKRSAAIFYRRNLWLLVFGLFHGMLIWSGDILFEYSVDGLMFLYPLRRLSARKLIAVGLILWIGCGLFTRVRRVEVQLRSNADLIIAKAAVNPTTEQKRVLVATGEKRREAALAKANEVTRLERLGYLGGLRHNLDDWLGFQQFILATFAFIDTVGAMILGMGLYKAGFLTNRRPAKEYLLLALGGYAVTFAFVLTGLWHTLRDGLGPLVVAVWMSTPAPLVVPCAVLANTSVILLLMRSGSLPWAIKPLAAVGRTAFSNYILTSLICKFIFSWGPWKLYGQLEFYNCFLIVGAVWTLNLVISTLWLRSFAFGPLEWLWRSLTYWKQQPFLLRDLRA